MDSRMTAQPETGPGMKLPGTCTATARHISKIECRNYTAKTPLAIQTSTISETTEERVTPHWNAVNDMSNRCNV